MTPRKTADPARLRIVSLTAENIKRITAVHIEPQGSLVQVTGANGSGKSSVLDSIWWALQGKGVVQSQPIRKGAEGGMIRIDFGSLIVTRHFQRDGENDYTTSLSVENDEGAIYSSPQKMLDGFLGSLSFDPLAFMEMDGKGKLAELRRIVKIDIDLDEVDRLNRGDYERRAQVNRTVRNLTENVASYAADLRNLGSGPTDLVDAAPLLYDMEQASNRNAAIERERVRREGARLQASNAQARVENLRAEAEGLRRRAAEVDADADRTLAAADAMTKETDALPALDKPVDVADLRAKVEEANAENERRRLRAVAKRRHDEGADLLKKAEAESQSLTDAMDKRNADKASAIGAAKMPVEGLSFGDGDVLWKGIPLDQASTAEQIRTSLAVGMAMNPGLRVILIRQGSLLDDVSVEIVRKWAEENDFQVWMERVDTSGKIGIIMENGEARVAG